MRATSRNGDTDQRVAREFMLELLPRGGRIMRGRIERPEREAYAAIVVAIGHPRGPTAWTEKETPP
jgi:hypothetical protein